VTGFLEGEDAISTMNAFRALGVRIEGPQQGRVTIHGVGLHGLKQSSAALDCGNSGTSMRLISGLLAGQPFDSTLVGDASLSKRPMKRVMDPLRLMGANIHANEGGRPPLNIQGNATLKAIAYTLPMASAQVKSSVLLAGLYAEGVTEVTEPAVTRDHTERMLRGFGVNVDVQGATVRLQGGQALKATRIDVPSDISSAAFFMVAASICEQADITLKHVGLNPTRTGVIDILKLMGANIELSNHAEVGGEPVADVRVRSAQLKGIEIPEHLVPLAIDEFPVLFVAAANAVGTTVLTGAEELRVKESDRIAVMADGLQACGVDAQPTADGMIIHGLGHVQGLRYQATNIESQGDHRIAMSFTVAAIRAQGTMIIKGAQTVDTSFPGFVALCRSLGMNVQSVMLNQVGLPPVIAIDGPTASGKGTVASLVAEKLGFQYLDSGAIYRVLAVAVEQQGLSPEQNDQLPAITELAWRLPVTFQQGLVRLNGEDVSAAIRTEQAGEMASRLAAIPDVRQALLQRQRDFRAGHGLVADGRDMGSVVFPDAALKVFLTASAEVRAQRRVAQIESRGLQADYQQIFSDLQARDARDTQRAVAPLKPCEDSKVLDCSQLGIQQVVDQICDWYQLLIK
jgi:3-phosphoshikimate 1-carboxyvinyltransferase/cytidylate kinase